MRKLILAAAMLLLCVIASPAQSHDAQLMATLAPTCTSTTPCYTNFYRVQVAGPTSACPLTLTAYGAIATNVPGTTVTATGTTTVYDDQDPALTSGASYCYAVTDLYVSGGGESAMGPVKLLTFPAPPGQPTSLGAVVKK